MRGFAWLVLKACGRRPPNPDGRKAKRYEGPGMKKADGNLCHSLPTQTSCT